MSALRPALAVRPRRLGLLLIIAGALLLLGFYTISDPARLAGHTPLDAADYAGYAICHRITERSFTVAGRQMPLCARCTGIYLGISLTFGLFLLAGRGRWSQLPPLPVLLVLLGFVGVMGLDGLNSYSHFFPDLPHVYEPRNWLRLVTGMGAGLAMGAIVFPALAQTLWAEQVDYPPLRSPGELMALLLVAGVLILLVLSNRPALLYVLGLASALGVVLILASLNCMILLIALRRDAQARSWSGAALPLLAGAVLALAQIALISAGRYALTGTLTGIPGL